MDDFCLELIALPFSLSDFRKLFAVFLAALSIQLHQYYSSERNHFNTQKYNLSMNAIWQNLKLSYLFFHPNLGQNLKLSYFFFHLNLGQNLKLSYLFFHLNLWQNLKLSFFFFHKSM